jgi:hypothetical protein
LAARAQTVTVQAGTSISVELMENVHSSFNTQGEVIHLQVTDPVVVDGVTVVPEGARVEAEVGNVEGTGMVGKAGGISFHPVRIAAADGQWLSLDPTNFGDEGEGAGAGMIFAIGLFAKGKPGFVPRGTNYRVTIRRDTEVSADVLAAERELSTGEVTLTGTVEPVATIRTKKSKPGRPISLELNVPSDLGSLVPTGATAVTIASFNDFVPERPVRSSMVEFDQRDNVLTATFDWWHVIRYAQPGRNSLITQVELSDGRIAQADLTMTTDWQID